ncbi:MAG: AGE family epimerase/isomerase, partial [Hyphococcus sp.]
MTDIGASCSVLRDWFVASALPLWAEKGRDPATGGFYEALAFDGSPITGRARRARVQARQIYTFTKSALKGWLPEGEPIAANA